MNHPEVLEQFIPCLIGALNATLRGKKARQPIKVRMKNCFIFYDFEASPRLPDDSYKNDHFNEEIYDGDKIRIQPLPRKPFL
jgi:hypothetical protein